MRRQTTPTPIFAKCKPTWRTGGASTCVRTLARDGCWIIRFLKHTAADLPVYAKFNEPIASGEDGTFAPLGANGLMSVSTCG